MWINQFQLMIRWKCLNCIVNWVLKYINFNCICIMVQKMLLKLWFELRKYIAANLCGGGNLTSCFTF